MNSTVISSLLPVVLLIAAGFIAGHRRWIRADAVKDLSNLVFLLLAPALVFRSMSAVHVETLSLRPVAAYFIAAYLIFAGALVVKGFTRSGAVIAMSATYSNTVMIGIPLIGLAYGDAGMVTLLTLVSLHALVLLTTATIVVELAVAREEAASGEGQPRHLLATVGHAIKSAVLNPVPLPILFGLAFAQTGWTIPAVIDKPLQLLGASFAPVALVMVGVTLAYTRVGHHFKGALLVATAKNLVHPLLVAGIGWALGVSGLPLTVMIVAASLPMGANAFLFAQRYNTEEDLVTSSVVVSTGLALLTVSLVMIFVG